MSAVRAESAVSDDADRAGTRGAARAAFAASAAGSADDADAPRLTPLPFVPTMPVIRQDRAFLSQYLEGTAPGFAPAFRELLQAELDNEPRSTHQPSSREQLKTLVKQSVDSDLFDLERGGTMTWPTLTEETHRTRTPWRCCEECSKPSSFVFCCSRLDALHFELDFEHGRSMFQPRVTFGLCREHLARMEISSRHMSEGREISPVTLTLFCNRLVGVPSSRICDQFSQPVGQMQWRPTALRQFGIELAGAFETPDILVKHTTPTPDTVGLIFDAIARNNVKEFDKILKTLPSDVWLHLLLKSIRRQTGASLPIYRGLTVLMHRALRNRRLHQDDLLSTLRSIPSLSPSFVNKFATSHSFEDLDRIFLIFQSDGSCVDTEDPRQVIRFAVFVSLALHQKLLDDVTPARVDALLAQATSIARGMAIPENFHLQMSYDASTIVAILLADESARAVVDLLPWFHEFLRMHVWKQAIDTWKEQEALVWALVYKTGTNMHSLSSPWVKAIELSLLPDHIKEVREYAKPTSSVTKTLSKWGKDFVSPNQPQILALNSVFEHRMKFPAFFERVLLKCWIEINRHDWDEFLKEDGREHLRTVCMASQSEQGARPLAVAFAELFLPAMRR